MTLDVENLHSVVHHKSGVSTGLQYARDFGSTAKESLKRITAWSAYYYTSRGLWYQVPERSLAMFEIPSMSQTSVVKASKRRNLRDEGAGKSTWICCTAKKLPWQGLDLCQTFCAKRKSKLDKESTCLQTVWQPQTLTQYPASLMQNSPNLRFTYSCNLQRFIFPSGEGQEQGLTPVSPGTCRSKYQLLQFV